MAVPEVKRLKPLEEENVRLKKQLVEAMLDKEVLQVADRSKLEAVVLMYGATSLSQRRDCRLTSLSLSTPVCVSAVWAQNADDVVKAGNITSASAPSGKPTPNRFIESFNGRFRDEYLNEHWFSDISHVMKIIGKWRNDYNEYRPHSTLNYLTPFEFEVGWRKRTSEIEGADITN